MFKRKKTNSTSINTKSVNLNSKKLKQKSTRLNYESLRLQLGVAKISIDRLENGEGIQKIDLPSPKQLPEVPGPSTSKAASSRKVKPRKVPPPKTFLVKAPPSKGKGRFTPKIKPKESKGTKKRIKEATGAKHLLVPKQQLKEPLIEQEEVERPPKVHNQEPPKPIKKYSKFGSCFPRRKSAMSNVGLVEGNVSSPIQTRKASILSHGRRSASAKSTQGRGWLLVKTNLPKIVEYGVSQGIIPPRAKQTAVVEDDPDDEDPDSREAKKKGYLEIPVRPDDSIFHSAIPFLPLPAAIPCCIINFILPGFGTIFSGLCVLCMGQPRIHYKTGRLGSTVMVNSVVGVCQLATITFMLVGWFWSIAWGGLIIIHAIEYNKAIVAERKENVATQALQALSKNGVVRKRDLKGFVQGGDNNV